MHTHRYWHIGTVSIIVVIGHGMVHPRHKMGLYFVVTMVGTTNEAWSAI